MAILWYKPWSKTSYFERRGGWKEKKGIILKQIIMQSICSITI
jgi:hypothetical protein